MNHADLARELLGFPGMMISGSKSGYTSKHPKHRVMFNANVTIDGTCVWHGDLDLDCADTAHRLRTLASSAGAPVHVLPETPYRFEMPSRDVILAGGLRDVVKID
jgi:hypothetical protein